MAIYRYDRNHDGLADGQIGLFLVVQTSLPTKRDHEMALLRRSFCLHRPLYCPNLPRHLHMHPSAEELQSETAGSLPTQQGRRIRHGYLQRHHRSVHLDIAATFCLVSAHEAGPEIAIDGIVWTWSVV